MTLDQARAILNAVKDGHDIPDAAIAEALQETGDIARYYLGLDRSMVVPLRPE